MAPKNEPQPALGRAIRELRTERGLSQEALAHEADTHPTWISHLESGRKNPSWALVKRIAGALGLSLSEFVAAVERFEVRSER
jgi:XRE family transcriptional regulator, regulator of sulfur utilization